MYFMRVKGQKKLFSGVHSRSEIVATFLAILELCRNDNIELREDRGQISVKLRKMPEQTEGGEADG